MKYGDLISIVMPVYNTEKFLDCSIVSVLKQNYENWELIITNNGSTDSSLEIIKKYASLDHRIHYRTILHVNTVKESRDSCIECANGKWICFLDSDDWLGFDSLSTMMRKAIESCADFVIQKMCFFDENNNVIKEIPDYRSFNISLILNGKEAVRYTLLKWAIGVNGALIAKENITNLSKRAKSNNTFYSDEYDSRVYLYNALRVCFVDTSYNVGFNPNSAGRRLSVAKYKYSVDTNIGLQKFIAEKYGKNSDEYVFVRMQLNSVFLSLYSDYLKNKSKFLKRERRECDSLLNQLYVALDFSKFSFIFRKNTIFFYLYKVFSFLYLAMRKILNIVSCGK